MGMAQQQREGEFYPLSAPILGSRLALSTRN
jgi:hypothetical protein